MAWTGRKLWPDNTIPEIYNRTLPTEADSACILTAWKPSVIVINLATKDFGHGNPDESGWTGAYEAFITRLRAVYFKAQIYIAPGPMMTDSYPPGQKAVSTLKAHPNNISADEAHAGDSRVGILTFAPQDAKNGIGADCHRNVRTHQILAATLIERISTDLGWKPGHTTARR